MNTRLTPGIILFGILLATLAGPLYTMRDVTSDQLQQLDYWWEIAAATVRSFAVATGTAISIVGSALGLPALFEKWRVEKPAGETS